MRRPKSKGRSLRKQRRLQETLEIELLQNWIQFGQPDPGSNPLSLPPLPKGSPLGRIGENAFSAYAGCEFFNQLPISKKTKDGLKGSNYVKMTDIQRASLPHSLCGRDILGAAKTGSGKTLAFVIPVLEKLYKERWGPEDGVGCIIISPTRELANQIFEVLNSVGKYHGFSAGVLIGGRKGVDTEKERVNDLNILVCTPGRLLQHMDETPNFECSQLQVLVLDEADRILDQGFKKEMNAVISQLPKSRQTLLFSATQTKKVQDLARLSLKDPEYLGVHEEAPTATPTGLIQVATIVPLHQKLDTLWSFIKLHLNSRILVFLTTRKQVKFVFEAFRKLRPGIPLMCLHGKMNQEKRLLTYSQFCGNRGVLFTTDVSARGLDFEKAIDWVVQVDCPPDVATYIHRVGRTARYNSGGKSFLILEPSEMKMLEKLKASKIPVIVKKQNKERMLPISPLLAALLVKYPDLQQWAQRAFITYLKSVKKEKDKEVFDVMKLPIDEFSASLGLPMTPKVRFLRRKNGDNNISKMSTPQTDDAPPQLDDSPAEDLLESPSREGDKSNEDESDNDLLAQGSSPEPKQDLEVIVPTTRVLKKKKLKINVHRPIGTRVVFDEQGNALPPLATIADTKGNSESSEIDIDKVQERYRKAREMLKQEDKVDKLHASKLRKEKRLKQKMKWKRDRSEDDEQEELSRSDEEAAATRNKNKKSKLYFNGDSDVEEEDKRKGDKINTDSITLPEQEALALKLLSSMHS